MLEKKFEELSEKIKDSDKLLRRLERVSKILTQHVQTSIMSFELHSRQK